MMMMIIIIIQFLIYFNVLVKQHKANYKIAQNIQ
jgi:hypothetical protein